MSFGGGGSQANPVTEIRVREYKNNLKLLLKRDQDCMTIFMKA